MKGGLNENKHNYIFFQIEFIFSGSRKGRISIYDPRDPVVCSSLSGHKRDVTNLKLSPDEEFLASGGDDGIVNIWSMRNNCVYRRIESHKACAKVSHPQNQRHRIPWDRLP